MSYTYRILFLALFYPCFSSSQVYMEMAMDSTMTYQQIVEEGEAFYDQYGKGAHTGYKTFQRWKYWMKRCLDGQGKMMGKSVRTREVEKFRKSQETNSRRLQLPQWTDMGPTAAGNTSGWSAHIGRVSSIAVDKYDKDHMLVGSPSGGIWKSTSGGDSWSPIFDHEPVIDIYSLCINPHDSNNYWAGTWGGGLVVSYDAGASWSRIPTIPTQTRLIDVKVSPYDPSIVVAINEGGNVYQSRNGGQSFDISLTHSSALFDVEFKPGGDEIAYVSGQNAVYVSYDNAWSFTEIDGPWKNSSAQYNPIMLAVTAADQEYLYALEADVGGFGALYLSVDGGQTFETISSDEDGDNNIMGYIKNIKGGQAPRDMDIVVSPTNKSEVHVGGIMTYRSLDAGMTWVQTTHWLIDDPLPFIHADIDKMCYVDDKIYFGTDGGLFVSDDSANSFVDKTSGLSIRQFYRLAISDDGNIIVGGSQDNGTGKLTGSNGWWDFVGADGMEPIIDKDNNDILYASIQYGYVYKTLTGGVALTGGIVPSPGIGDWVTPIEQDPILQNTIYQGKQQLHKTTDGMASWSTISDFVMNNPADSTMQEMDVAFDDSDYIVVGFEEQVFKTENGGDSWEDISPSFLFSNVNYIDINHRDKNRMLLALSGANQRIVETTDGGTTWNDLMLNIPNIAVECVIYEGGPKEGIYAALDPGVYYTDNTMQDWIAITENMPNVLVAELEIHDCELYAATYGRGLWKTSILDDSVVYMDVDGDGYGDENNAVRYCDAPAATTEIAGDCDDNNSNIYPGALEICNSLDDNCDGYVDNGTVGGIESEWYADSDGDGFGDPDNTIMSCNIVTGYVANNNDCNDYDPLIHPDAQEACNLLDDNCNGSIDEGLAVTIWYKDNDGDGYGNKDISKEECMQTPGFVINNLDCNDNDPYINPDAVESCNMSDDNCDGLVDENLPVTTWYEDHDGDGYGNADISQEACMQIPGYVLNQLDCDDSNAAVNPYIIEICNMIDDNCDGVVDEGTSESGPLSEWYQDADGDGYGNLSEKIISCDIVEGYVRNHDDCDDQNATIYPSAIESCNNLDDDCNGQIDDVSNSALGLELWFRDIDGDGFGQSFDIVRSCTRPEGYARLSEDCNDEDASINPYAHEVCDGKDNDCDGVIDEECDLIECDGTYLFVADALKEEYNANRGLFSNAKLSGGLDYQFNAGEQIVFLPGFELEIGSTLETEIRPCSNGVSARGISLSNELTIINDDLNISISKGELVCITVLMQPNDNVYQVSYLKDKADLKYILSRLETGQYTIVVESNSISWNRSFDVISKSN